MCQALVNNMCRASANSKCQVNSIGIWVCALKNLKANHVACQLRDKFQVLEDKIESFRVPMYFACNQWNNCKAKEAKWMNLSHRFITNPKSWYPFKKDKAS